MDPIDAPLMNTAAGLAGAMLGGFLIAMLPAFVLLRLAGSPRRRPSTAANLRVLGVVAAGGLTVLGAIGGGLNLGSVLAVLLAGTWAFVQHKRSRQPR